MVSLGIVGKIILKWIFNKEDEGVKGKRGGLKRVK
jgi:hypothetical protein